MKDPTVAPQEEGCDWSSFEDWQRFRARIEHEDNLLNSRAGIFLVVNGLGAVAIGLTPHPVAALTIVLVMLLANCLWIAASCQMVRVLKALSRFYIRHASDPIDGVVRKSMKRWPLWFRNTDIIGLYLPLVVTFAWLIGLGILIRSSK